MSVLGELRRRNVFRVGIAYLIAAWLVLQVIDVVGEIIGVPEWVPKAILLLLVVGFPIVLLFAWAFELTPEGLKFERDVDRSTSTTQSTGRRLDFVIIGILSVALVFFALDKFVWSVPADDQTAVSTRSIAVLPFANMSGDPEQRYFSDGITEEILNSLVRVPGISVASRTSSFKYRGEEHDIPKIATELDVLFVLEGSVRRSEDDLRITAQLIDAATDRHIWSQVYPRKLIDIFEIQSDIANSIARAIESELGLDQATAIATKTLTENMSAYDYYLKGYNSFLHRSNSQDVRDAMANLEQAVELDPEFAEAWQYLAAVYAVVPYMAAGDLDTYLDKSDEALDRALAIDPNLALVYAIRGSNASVRPPYPIAYALELYDKAISLDSAYATPHTWKSVTLLIAGHFEKGIESATECLEIDPKYWHCLNSLGGAYLAQGRYEMASEVQHALLEQGPYEFWGTHVSDYMAVGNKTAARIAAANIEPLAGAPLHWWINALEYPEEDHSDNWHYFETWADQEGVDLDIFSALKIAFGQYDGIDLRYAGDPWFWNPLFYKYRKSPQFKAEMKRVGYFKYWTDEGFPPQCQPVGNDDFECD